MFTREVDLTHRVRLRAAQLRLQLPASSYKGKLGGGGLQAAGVAGCGMRCRAFQVCQCRETSPRMFPGRAQVNADPVLRTEERRARDVNPDRGTGKQCRPTPEAT